VRWCTAKPMSARQSLDAHGKDVTHGKDLIIGTCTLPAAQTLSPLTLSASSLLALRARRRPHPLRHAAAAAQQLVATQPASSRRPAAHHCPRSASSPGQLEPATAAQLESRRAATPSSAPVRHAIAAAQLEPATAAPARVQLASATHACVAPGQLSRPCKVKVSYSVVISVG
jgi:hypothetical protein